MSENWFKALRNKMEGITPEQRKAIEALDAKEDAAEKKKKAAAAAEKAAKGAITWSPVGANKKKSQLMSMED